MNCGEGSGSDAVRDLVPREGAALLALDEEVGPPRRCLAVGHRVGTKSLDLRRDAAEARRQVAGSWTAQPPSLDLSGKTDQLSKNQGSREYAVGVALPLWLPGERSRQGALADAESKADGCREYCNHDEHGTETDAEQSSGSYARDQPAEAARRGKQALDSLTAI